ncbi:hypothetical protein ABW21_db0200640 [Orbilia brochopaga]|nr:hypothetical protein ABW21_db0200640 [Drechslerella brochopaga]
MMSSLGPICLSVLLAAQAVANPLLAAAHNEATAASYYAPSADASTLILNSSLPFNDSMTRNPSLYPRQFEEAEGINCQGSAYCFYHGGEHNPALFLRDFIVDIPDDKIYGHHDLIACTKGLVWPDQYDGFLCAWLDYADHTDDGFWDQEENVWYRRGDSIKILIKKLLKHGCMVRNISPFILIPPYYRSSAAIREDYARGLYDLLTDITILQRCGAIPINTIGNHLYNGKLVMDGRRHGCHPTKDMHGICPDRETFENKTSNTDDETVTTVAALKNYLPTADVIDIRSIKIDENNH